MKKELEEKLYTEFPKLFIEAKLSAQENCMGRGVECGSGWYSIIRGMCTKLQQWSDKNNEQIILKQVKEKFGILRIYCDPYPSIGTKINDIVKDAEELSREVCENCGVADETAKYKKRDGWLSTICEKCSKK